jgi:hypothetical protein
MNTDDNISIKGSYEIKYDNHIPFLYVNSNKGMEKYLILKNNYVCCIYDENGKSKAYGMTGNGKGIDRLYLSASEIKASSHLIEGDVIYSANNLNRKVNLGIPWVEGVKGYGINEEILLKRGYAKRLYLSIGFVSYQKPYLYEQNSRPKKIELSVAGKYSFTYILEDTPNYQAIELPEVLSRDDELVIKILDVFPGSKYEDTCINSILYDRVE